MASAAGAVARESTAQGLGLSTGDVGTGAAKRGTGPGAAASERFVRLSCRVLEFVVLASLYPLVAVVVMPIAAGCALWRVASPPRVAAAAGQNAQQHNDGGSDLKQR